MRLPSFLCILGDLHLAHSGLPPQALPHLPEVRRLPTSCDVRSCDHPQPSCQAIRIVQTLSCRSQLSVLGTPAHQCDHSRRINPPDHERNLGPPSRSSSSATSLEPALENFAPGSMESYGILRSTALVSRLRQGPARERQDRLMLWPRAQAKVDAGRQGP